METGGIFMESV